MKTTNSSSESGSEKNFRDFFNNNIDFLFILDMEGNIIEINNAVKQILGYSEEELIGKNVLLVHPPEFREQAADIVMKMLTGETSSCPVPLLTKDSNHIPVETRVFPGIWNSQDALIGVSRNLTELKHSEEKFSHVFNINPVMMALSTVDSGTLINVNESFLRVLGYKKEDLIGKSTKDLKLFHDYNQRQQALEIFNRDKRLENFEALIKSNTDEILTCLFSIDKIKIQTHEYLLTSAVDITQLKKAEARNKHLFEQQKLIADVSQLLNDHKNLRANLNSVIELVGKHTNVSRVYIFEDSESGSSTKNAFEWCNNGIEPQIKNLQDLHYDLIPSWKKLLRSDGIIISNNISELPEDIFRVLEPQEIKSIIIYPLYVQNSRFGFVGFDNCIADRIWQDDEIELLRTVSNNIANAFERMIVHNKLENSELRLKLAMQSAKEGLWDWNIETGHVYFSDMWCSMLGYQPSEIEPNVSSWEKLVHPDDMPYVMKVLNMHLNGETEYYETIHRVKTKNGNWNWILDHGMVVHRDSENKPIRAIGTHTDITEQKEIEHKLKELIDTKNKLFSIIGHDLRGPIGYFIEALELLTNDQELDDASKNKFLMELKKISRNTLNLLENLLNWSRSVTKNIQLAPKFFQINDLITDNIEFLSSNASRKEIEIINDFGNEFSVFADTDSISLVVRNLLSNAIKFTPNKGKITISTKLQDNFVEVSIADNGVGMEKEVMENLFGTSFYTTRGTNNEKGTGLGLMLCKDFVKKNGGEIFVDSILDKGTRFTFTIPVGE